MAVVAALRVAEKAGPDALVVDADCPTGSRLYVEDLQRRVMSSHGFLRKPSTNRCPSQPWVTCCAVKSGELPDLVHTHPSETVRDAIGILREYGVSQMPVVGPSRR